MTPILLFGALAALFLYTAIRGYRTGESNSGMVGHSRSRNPIIFWSTISIQFLLGLLCLGVALITLMTAKEQPDSSNAASLQGASDRARPSDTPPLIISVRRDFQKGRSLVFTNGSDKTLHPIRGTLERANGEKHNFTPPDAIAPHATVLISYLELPLPKFFDMPEVGDAVTVSCSGYAAPARVKINEVGQPQ
jgi:hypothetical protein